MGHLKDNMVEEMKLRGYSSTTIKMYTNCLCKLASYYMKSPLAISQSEIREFFINLVNRGASQTQMHIHYCAMKLFYRIHGRSNYMDFLPRPKQSYRIPEVLDESEIQTILSLCRSLRYKMLFTIIYSAGLRISEAVNLRVSDIDVSRRTIHVRASKNMKDRYTILSEKALLLLERYSSRYEPESLLFFSIRDKRRTMSKRHCQQVFHDLVKEARISKKAHVHTLRHSFATHLLEHDTNIFYIMKLLGHSSIRTTMIYLHMRRLDTMNIRSPLDVGSISLDQYACDAMQPFLKIA
jgi:integrase/recombinase XerD